MGSVYPRRKKLWIRFKGPDGWTQQKTPYHVGEERKARKVLLDVEARMTAGILMGDTPTILTKYQLGEAADKDPEWRVTARYSRDELEILISDPRLPFDRRVFYALEGIAGLRLGEAAGLRFRHYDPSLKPLGCLLIATSYDTGRTKTKQPRRMPAHPTLAAILAEWKLSG